MAARHPDEHALISALGGLTTRARYGGEAQSRLTEPGRSVSEANLNETLLREIDPDRSLSERDRAIRLDAARRAHFKRLSLKAVTARRRAREQAEAVA